MTANSKKKSAPAKQAPARQKAKAKTAAKKQPADKLGFAEGFGWAVAVALLLTALVMVLSYTSFLIAGSPYCFDRHSNWLGGLGVWVSLTFFQNGFGLATYFVPVFFVAAALRIFRIGKLRLWKWFVNCTFLMVWLSVTDTYLQLLPALKNSILLAGGMHGVSVLRLLRDKIGDWGTMLILVCTALLYVLYASGETVRTIRRLITAAREHANRRLEAKAAAKLAREAETEQVARQELEEQEGGATPTVVEFGEDGDEAGTTEGEGDEQEMEIEVPAGEGEAEAEGEGEGDAPAERGEQPEDPNAEAGARLIQGHDEPEARFGEERTLEPYDPKLDLENYKYPTIDLLQKYDTGGGQVDMEEQRNNKSRILSLFSNFGVDVTIIKATVGPTVTLYEIKPGPNVRIAKIRNLEDDIALQLSAVGIRIIAPIPGRDTIGIEVPNAKPRMVSMESIINTRKFQETDFELPMALGKTITNEVFMVDLAKMPHLLVAGATGQGKSVGLNAIITSLLYKKHPAELKLVMVDPKKVEFSVYYPIVNHFLAQVEGTENSEDAIITDVSKVITTLKSLCQEMDTRYDLLKRARARNVKEYNAKFRDRKLNPELGHRFMPYIVVIIDEFGDLIMTAGKEVELPIARIAQLARAVGIHMIIATQRPSVNIITGPIRANFPARMAFKVSSMTDSRIILDRPGANRLVGKGDMLFLAGNDPVRVQCAFVDTPEVERVCEHIACQQSYNAPFPLPLVEGESDDQESPEVDMEHLDPIFEKAAQLIVDTQQGSTSLIQRKLGVGYNRAGRLMDQLEKAGIVGEAHGSKPRDVLCPTQAELEYILNNLR